MQWIPFFIGDYERDTKDLTPEQDGIYFRLLRHMWATGHLIPLGEGAVFRIASAFSDSEQTACRLILSRFFVRTENGYLNQKAIDTRKRQQQLMTKQETFSNKQRARVMKRYEHHGITPESTTVDTAVSTTALPKPDPDPEPRSRKREKDLGKKASRSADFDKSASAQTSKKTDMKGKRLPKDWYPSAELVAWAEEERPDLDIVQTVAKFKDHWPAVPGHKGCKLDWEATFRNWVRDEKGCKKAAVPEKKLLRWQKLKESRFVVDTHTGKQYDLDEWDPQMNLDGVHCREFIHARDPTQRLYVDQLRPE